jgi:hypothetical protein
MTAISTKTTKNTKGTKSYLRIVEKNLRGLRGLRDRRAGACRLEPGTCWRLASEACGLK